jgi:hypothetical protein
MPPCKSKARVCCRALAAWTFVLVRVVIAIAALHLREEVAERRRVDRKGLDEPQLLEEKGP